MSKNTDEQFARLFTLDDGAQVLFTKECFDDLYQIKMRTDHEGVSISANLGFAGDCDMEEAFAKMDKAVAENFKQNILNKLT